VLDILTFNRFVTQDVLIFFYYIGALVVPVILWLAKDYLHKESPYFSKKIENLLHYYQRLKISNKALLWLVFITLFICMELCWRMMFEMMIGYFDMHNYLYQMTTHLQP